METGLLTSLSFSATLREALLYPGELCRVSRAALKRDQRCLKPVVCCSFAPDGNRDLTQTTLDHHRRTTSEELAAGQGSSTRFARSPRCCCAFARAGRTSLNSYLSYMHNTAESTIHRIKAHRLVYLRERVSTTLPQTSCRP